MRTHELEQRLAEYERGDKVMTTQNAVVTTNSRGN